MLFDRLRAVTGKGSLRVFTVRTRGRVKSAVGGEVTLATTVTAS